MSEQRDERSRPSAEGDRYMLAACDPARRNSGIARLVSNPSWGVDWQKYYFEDAHPRRVGAWMINGVTEVGDMLFHARPAKPEGTTYLLFKAPGQTEDDLRQAEAWLRDHHEASCIEVFHITCWWAPPTPEEQRRRQELEDQLFG